MHGPRYCILERVGPLLLLRCPIHRNLVAATPPPICNRPMPTPNSKTSARETKCPQLLRRHLQRGVSKRHGTQPVRDCAKTIRIIPAMNRGLDPTTRGRYPSPLNQTPAQSNRHTCTSSGSFQWHGTRRKSSRLSHSRTKAPCLTKGGMQRRIFPRMLVRLSSRSFQGFAHALHSPLIGLPCEPQHSQALLALNDTASSFCFPLLSA